MAIDVLDLEVCRLVAFLLEDCHSIGQLGVGNTELKSSTSADVKGLLLLDLSAQDLGGLHQHILSLLNIRVQQRADTRLVHAHLTADGGR